MIEILTGTKGVAPAVLLWLLTLYPVLTLPLLVRMVSASGEPEPRVVSRKKRRRRRGRKPGDPRVQPEAAAPRPAPVPHAHPASAEAAPLPAWLEDIARDAWVRSAHEVAAAAPPRGPAPAPVAPRAPQPTWTPPAPTPLAAPVQDPLGAAASRVAGNPELDEWIRNAARTYLRRAASS